MLISVLYIHVHIDVVIYNPPPSFCTSVNWCHCVTMAAVWDISVEFLLSSHLFCISWLFFVYFSSLRGSCKHDGYAICVVYMLVIFTKADGHLVLLEKRCPGESQSYSYISSLIFLGIHFCFILIQLFWFSLPFHVPILSYCRNYSFDIVVNFWCSFGVVI